MCTRQQLLNDKVPEPPSARMSILVLASDPSRGSRSWQEVPRGVVSIAHGKSCASPDWVRSGHWQRQCALLEAGRRRQPAISCSTPFPHDVHARQHAIQGSWGGDAKETGSSVRSLNRLAKQRRESNRDGSAATQDVGVGGGQLLPVFALHVRPHLGKVE